MAYLDNNATTPIDPEVRRTIDQFYVAGNISANYNTLGRVVRDIATKSIVDWIGYPGCKVIFTSCASESNNLIIRSITDYYLAHGHSKPHIVASLIEHETTIKCLEQLLMTGRADVTFVAPNMYGTIDPVEVAKAIRDDTALVTVMHANNELGSINDIYSIAAVCKDRGVRFHTDAVQTIGKFRVNNNKAAPRILNISCSFHKLHGPIGFGCLVVSPDVADMITSFPQITGTQNFGMRGGTSAIQHLASVPVILAKISVDRHGRNQRMAILKGYLFDELQRRAGFLYIPYETMAEKDDAPFGTFTVLGKNCIPNTLSLAFPRIDNLKLQTYMADNGVFISVGSACSMNRHSRVLLAVGAPLFIAESNIRVSLSDMSTISDCDAFVSCLMRYVNQ